MINRLFITIIFSLYALLYPAAAFAQQNSFVSIVNPVRGDDFKQLKDQKPEEAVLGQAEILNKFSLPATWLLRYDVLSNKSVIGILNSRNDEKGLFLEITPTWTNQASVLYRQSSSWHNAGSAFLSGYETKEREQLIDAAFEKFKSIFNYYPKSVGAWWVDAYSANYMQQKYGINSVLIVADQYTTDNYQIWGQYWSTPYYPSKKHLLHPAQSEDNKIPVVIIQWAARDPVNAYGSGVEESTFSVQSNDYIDYHNLKTDYFEKLVDIYTKQQHNKFGFLAVGLENSYDWKKYKNEYENQIKLILKKIELGQLSVVTASDFAAWYKRTFPQISPEHIIIADDPLGNFKKTVWFMNPYYRAGWFFNEEGSSFRDIRQYIEGEEELCFQIRCDLVNFATFATRVLDDVSFGHKLSLDEGKIQNFQVTKNTETFIINYKNEGGNIRRIEFLPRDIKIDDKISSIDGLILDATKYQLEDKKGSNIEEGFFKWSPGSVLLKIIKFSLFLLIGCLVPGSILINNILNKESSLYQKITIAITLGFILLTLFFYILSLFKVKELIFVYLLMNTVYLISSYKKLSSFLSLKIKFKFLPLLLIIVGTIFQQLPMFKNGLIFPYGMGLWGPNTHDSMWHISLINQLTRSVPPQNPIFADTTLKNYHFFYDLLVSATAFLTGVPVLDLVFRFYPIIFSLLLGIGTYYLMKTLFESRLNNFQMNVSILISLFLIFFAGSFGWVVEYIKARNFSGESAFWANQSISFNLNPPFALSLIIVIIILQLLSKLSKNNKFSILVLTILCGSLIVFKTYAGVLVLLSLFIVAVLKRSLDYLIIFFTSLGLSVLLFLPSFNTAEKIIIFSPFWFIHSMIDSPDRVGWVRLSLARITGWEKGNWFKFLSAEVISFFIFLIGNLGMRFFALFSLIRMKTIFQRREYLFIFIFSSAAFFIPILFIQAGNPWNTIQFVYYFLYFAALVAGVVISIIFRFKRILALIIILPILIITPINSWTTASSYLSYRPHAFISTKELEALNFLKSQREGVVLTYPYNSKLKKNLPEPWPLFVYDSTAYVSAISQKSTFVEDEPQNQILLTDYKKRIISSKDFFLRPDLSGEQFLKDNNIKYIYIPKRFNLSIDEKLFTVDKIFENKEVLIYQTRQ